VGIAPIGPDQRSQRLDLSALNVRPALVELGQHQLYEPLGAYRIPAEQVGGGLQQRAFLLDRVRVPGVVHAASRHGSPLVVMVIRSRREYRCPDRQLILISGVTIKS
jgi:hypothetical protein